MVLPNPGRGYPGYGYGYDRELHYSPSENNCPIYRSLSIIGAMYGIRVAPEVTGYKIVVITEGHGLVGRTVGGDSSRYGGDRCGGGEVG